MSGRASASLLAGSLLASVIFAGSARATPWDDVAHPNRRRCEKLVADADRLAGNHEWKSAVEAVRSAVALCPSDRLVLQRAGETLLGAHEHTEGRLRLERARVLAERTPASREDEKLLAFHLGYAREVTGDLDGAIEEHRRLEAMGGLPPPNGYMVHYNLGDELMAVGRLGEAIDEYRRAVTLAGAKPVVRLALAVALDRDEQVDQARTELAGVLAFDPELRTVNPNGDGDYVFVPPADIHYYKALALAERGSAAEARLELRQFLAELPSGPYSAHARRRLAGAESHVDARELEVAAGAIDTRLVATALGPAVAALEGCLPAGRVVRVRLLAARGSLRPEPAQPTAECLDRALSRVDAALLAALKPGAVVVPLAGRRAAASPP